MPQLRGSRGFSGPGGHSFGEGAGAHDLRTVAAGCDIDFLAGAGAGDRLVATAVERVRAGRSGLYDVTVRREADGAVIAELRGRSRTVSGRVRRSAGDGE